MRIASAVLVLVFAAACQPAEQAEPAPEEMEESTPTLADFAGTWENQATLEGVAEPVPSTMHGTATASGWTMDLEGRPGIPVSAQVVGDSLIVQTDTYESVLRAGVMVSVRTASVLRGDSLIGNLVATYRTEDGEEVVRGMMRGTRASN